MNQPTCSADRHWLLLRATCVFWFVAKAISWKLWVSDRTFPSLPTFDFLDSVPIASHYVLFILSCVCLVTLFFKPVSRWVMVTLLISEILSCLLDQCRWQPWQFLYLLIIYTFVVNYFNAPIRQKALTYLFAFLYLYSGLHKLNIEYLANIWDSMVLRRFLRLSPVVIKHPLLFYAGLIPVLLELVAGVMLMFRKTSRLAASWLIAMHVFILGFIGPLGLRYNVIVWPWNILMIVCLYLLFFQKEQVSYSIHLKTFLIGPNVLVIVLCGIMPLLSFMNRWDQYLSGNLYSGKLRSMAICISRKDDVDVLRPYVQAANKTPVCRDGKLLKVQTWSLKEMKVPLIPEARVYKQLKKIFQKKYPETVPVFFIYSGPYFNQKWEVFY